MNVSRLAASIAAVRTALAALRGATTDRALADLNALDFHLRPMPTRPIVALLGGTGTGKSTLSNRLLETASELTASNYRRTFTAGPVAIVGEPLPADWLGLPHVPATTLPARGEANALVVVQHASRLTGAIALVDTPDVDGDQPAHHALADRTFRWAHAAVFVVSPEKYQMTELLPYFRLATRYGVPAWFVMNKVDDRAVLEDFARQLATTSEKTRVYANARDDATFAPSREESLDALREALTNFAANPSSTAEREPGVSRRAHDVASRISDTVLEPMRVRRTKTDEAISALRALRTREVGVDVDPMTRALRKRMQQRSVLYLMGPQRMLERLKNAPAMLARLPKSTIDLFRGKSSASADEPTPSKVELPDFATMVGDQFLVAQEQMADVVRQVGPREAKDWRAESDSRVASDPASWVLSHGEGSIGLHPRNSESHVAPSDEAASLATRETPDARFDTSKSRDPWRLDRSLASEIVTSETDSLRQWLEARWNANPRDTALILKLVQKLPGGHRLTKLSESAPYLVVLVCGLNHLAFSGLDLLVIGGFSVVTWLGEKMSDEVAQRTRQANKNIDQRFGELIRRQADAAIAHLNASAPRGAELDALARHLDDLRDAAEGPA